MGTSWDLGVRAVARDLGVEVLGFDAEGCGWWIMGPNGRGWISSYALERWISSYALERADGDAEAVVDVIASAGRALSLPPRYRFRLGRRLRR